MFFKRHVVKKNDPEELMFYSSKMPPIVQGEDW